MLLIGDVCRTAVDIALRTSLCDAATVPAQLPARGAEKKRKAHPT